MGFSLIKVALALVCLYKFRVISSFGLPLGLLSMIMWL